MLELMEHVVKVRQTDANQPQGETWVEVYMLDGRSVVMFVPGHDFHAHDVASEKLNGNANLIERYRVKDYRGYPPHYKVFLGE